ncbi:MAG: tRNA (adenosine(37)-N6)-threonylcarbamoyltransferase complex dimerization subunit type 1 TsaB [Clostridia bacterium]|nr:tRNA (adenosine(37)-N6)-threonylcarbamoyltransferase complex dimerization subunit type 1 TsaB [Clostridia bacterium]
MYVLAIETTGPYASVALIDGKAKIAASKVSKELMNHLKDLMPIIDELLKEAKVEKKDLTAIACSVGPGSFTGIRIGVSTARALAQALDIPCVPVKTLNAFIYQEKKEGLICPIINARRGQVYGAIFDRGDYNCRTILAPGPYMLEDVLKAIEEKAYGKVVFYGDGIDAYEEIISERIPKDRREYAAKNIRYQSAESVAQDAFMKVLWKKTVSYDKLEPEYMRETEAETKLKDGSLERERKAKMERMS